MSVERIGISHSLPEGTEVIHSSILGVNCLGRISDLLAAWCVRALKTSPDFLGDFRLLAQSLMEFSCPKSGDSLGQVELAEHAGLVIIATRFPCRLVLNTELLAQELTQYWLNSEDLKLFKRMLSPQDRVEVRYHEKLNLIEWRVSRPVGEAQEVLDHSDSFQVLSDNSIDIQASNVVFKELGDLPFNEWLTDVYRNQKLGNRAGSVTVEGGESQDDQEWARIVVERETHEIAKEADRIVESEQLGDQNQESTTFQRSEEIEKIFAENMDLKAGAKQVALRVRKIELDSEREKNLFQQKLTQFESLLHKKEYMNQRHQTELKVLNEKISELKNNPDTSRSEHFRVKALEMYEMLKNVKDECKSLERTVHEMKRKERDASDGPSSTGMSQKYIDELNKKVERNQRALEAEKLKVKTLSERVIVAEKEAQSAGPLIDDLESKMEHTLKSVQQHKKETEQVKQKLVQADAEKNKIKNDLMKAQAQIQTLLKRQAA